MANVIYLFEDYTYKNFYPLTYNRPVYELLFGIMKLREKVALHFPQAEIRLLCREFLQLHLAQQTGLKVNDFSVRPDYSILLLNSRVVVDSVLMQKIDFNTEKSFWHQKDLVAVVLNGKTFQKLAPNIANLPEQSDYSFFRKDFPAEEIEAKLLNYLWDFVSGNSEELTKDFTLLKPKLNFKHMFDKCSVDQQAVIYKPENVYIGKNTRIEAFVVLNAESGPIFIDDECIIQAFTRIEGPAYIGKQTQIYGAKISGGCSFGPDCRLGGEIQNSIFWGYSNKYHDGFIGHSYLGQWVNLGAGTTNSDLKNNYSAVRVNFPDSFVDTGQSKVGSFIGDQVKTGIGTLLNTGAYVGLGANIFGGGMIKAKFIPSFAWGNVEGLHEYAWEKFIDTARVVMARRNVELLNSEEEVLKKIFQLTKSERGLSRA